jgi:hypothetical protein
MARSAELTGKVEIPAVEKPTGKRFAACGAINK